MREWCAGAVSGKNESVSRILYVVFVAAVTGRLRLADSI